MGLYQPPLPSVLLSTGAKTAIWGLQTPFKKLDFKRAKTHDIFFAKL